MAGSVSPPCSCFLRDDASDADQRWESKSRCGAGEIINASRGTTRTPVTFCISICCHPLWMAIKQILQDIKIFDLITNSNGRLRNGKSFLKNLLRLCYYVNASEMNTQKAEESAAAARGRLPLAAAWHVHCGPLKNTWNTAPLRKRRETGAGRCQCFPPFISMFIATRGAYFSRLAVVIRSWNLLDRLRNHQVPHFPENRGHVVN